MYKYNFENLSDSTYNSYNFTYGIIQFSGPGYYGRYSYLLGAW